MLSTKGMIFLVHSFDLNGHLRTSYRFTQTLESPRTVIKKTPLENDAQNIFYLNVLTLEFYPRTQKVQPLSFNTWKGFQSELEMEATGLTARMFQDLNPIGQHIERLANANDCISYARNVSSNVSNNRPSQHYTHPNEHTTPTYFF